MPWDQQCSLDRIVRRWEPVTLRSRSEARPRHGPREHHPTQQSSDPGGPRLRSVAGPGLLQRLDTEGHAEGAIRRIALWQAEVDRIAKAFDVPIIAFQGARVHLLTFRPIDADADIARCATLVARAIIFMTRDAFNPLFDSELQLSARAAADLGETVATRGGVRGDSELLFLGNAANRPAKLLGDSKLIVTDRFMDAHGDDLEHEKIEADEDDAWILRHSVATIEAAAAEDGIDWSVEKSAAGLAT